MKDSVLLKACGYNFESMRGFKLQYPQIQIQTVTDPANTTLFGQPYWDKHLKEENAQVVFMALFTEVD